MGFFGLNHWLFSNLIKDACQFHIGFLDVLMCKYFSCRRAGSPYHTCTQIPQDTLFSLYLISLAEYLYSNNCTLLAILWIYLYMYTLSQKVYMYVSVWYYDDPLPSFPHHFAIDINLCNYAEGIAAKIITWTFCISPIWFIHVYMYDKEIYGLLIIPWHGM